MGFKPNQVSTDGLDLSHNSLLADHRHRPLLNCPRCKSLNTKFCYYNNYNKTQPRHYCKSCKRHWTQGGTLRDVPVGGNRRNKCLKTTSSSSSSSSVDCMQDQQYLLTLDTNTFLLDSTLSPNFHLDTSTPFESLISSFSFTNPNQFQLSNSEEISQVTGENPSNSSRTGNYDNNNKSETIHRLYELPSTSSLMGSFSDWSWDDLNMLISTTATNTTDKNQLRDDSKIEEHGV